MAEELSEQRLAMLHTTASDLDEQRGSPGLWPKRCRLTVADPLHSLPWASFWSHLIFGMFFCVALPFAMQVCWEFWRHIDWKDPTYRSYSSTAYFTKSYTSTAYFPPWGLALSCLVALVAAAIRLGCDVRLMNMVYRVSVLRRVFNSCCIPRCCVVMVLVLLFSTLPMTAWLNRGVWNAVVVDEFFSCKRECLRAERCMQQEWGCDVMSYEELNTLCAAANVTQANGTHAHWNHTGVLLQITASMSSAVGYAEPDSETSGRTCLDVLRVHETRYIRTLLDKGSIIGAFESRFRLHYQVGVLEVYGAALAISCFIMMVASRLALCTKLRALNIAKKDLIRTKFLNDLGTSDTYQWLFERMHQFQGVCHEDKWISKILKRGTDVLRERDPSKDLEAAQQRPKEGPEDRPMLKENELFSGQDANDDDRVDETGSARCRSLLRDSLKPVLIGIMYASGQVLIPGFFRMMNILGAESRDFWAMREESPALMLNAVVVLILNAYWFGRFVLSFQRHQDKLQQTIAFNCLWRFPGQHPIMLTKREELPLLPEVWCAIAPVGCDSPRSCDVKSHRKLFFSDEGYRAEWGTMGGTALMEELSKLEEWYHMRHYLQIDRYDDRVSIELAMVVPVASLMPKVAVIVYNFLVLEAWEGRLQAINFVALWDSAFIFYWIFQALMTTLAFNDFDDRHRESLSELIEYIKVETVQAPSGEWTHVAAAPAGEQTHAALSARGQQAVRFVETFQTALERFDAPATFFTMRVNRTLITGIGFSTLSVLLPQILGIYCASFSSGF